ncbi:hypothetical protein H0X48_01160 [Candidatus Dependentiae bacterium]|nr:hypothetical protein [Candidatus Dependentiae bacterium]
MKNNPSILIVLLACMVLSHSLISSNGSKHPMLHELLANPRYKQSGTATERVFEGPSELYRTLWTVQTTTIRYTFKNSSPVATHIYRYTSVVPTFLGWCIGMFFCLGIVVVMSLLIRKLKKRRV